MSIITESVDAPVIAASPALKPQVIEPLLEEDQNRFVLFPIKDHAMQLLNASGAYLLQLKVQVRLFRWPRLFQLASLLVINFKRKIHSK
jgi:hypothetical protein